MSTEVAVIAIDGGELPLGGGLLALVRPALDQLEPGGMLAVLSRCRGVREDLPTWCRVERHEYLGVEETADGLDRHLITRGRFSVPSRSNWEHSPLDTHHRRLTAADVLKAAPMPSHADPITGFAPRGARIESGGPSYPFTLNERDRVAPPEVAALYDQAVESQWNANSDIPWSQVRSLPEDLERALIQVMTFLAENELSAL